MKWEKQRNYGFEHWSKAGTKGGYANTPKQKVAHRKAMIIVSSKLTKEQRIARAKLAINARWDRHRQHKAEQEGQRNNSGSSNNATVSKIDPWTGKPIE